MYRLALALSFAAASAHAAPMRIDATYDLYRNGLKLGQVVDQLKVEHGRYTLTSESRTSGALKFLWSGVIRLESSGEVTPAGLRPLRFVHSRSDKPDKTATARFDWPAGAMNFDYRGKSWSVPGLAAGAQDQLSQIYQFAFLKTLPGDFALQVAGGRDLNDYRYAARAGETLTTPLGSFATRRYERVGQRPEDKAVSVWIAPGKHRLPLKVRIVDEGVTLEQRLVAATVRD